jgi:hypothetical protein
MRHADKHVVSLRLSKTAGFKPQISLKNNLEELNAVPFSGVVWIERRALDPCAVACRRPWIEHLEWVTPIAKSSRNHSLDRRAL